jgi:hypothetical protein
LSGAVGYGETARVRFEVEHIFPAPPDDVADILCDPEFHVALELPDLSLPTVVDSPTTGAVRSLRLRYEFVGQLDPIARRVLAGRRLTWIQELQLDADTGHGRLTFEAESEPGRLHGRADVLLARSAGAQTRRSIAGEFFVRVPLVGGTAERRIVPGLVRRLDVEAAALTAVLEQRSAPS